MLIGAAVGVLAGIGVPLLHSVRLRPDLAILMVLGVPSVAGLLTILLSSRRWTTGMGAFLVALGVGWFAALAATTVVSGA